MKLSLTNCTVRSWADRDIESLARYADNRKIWRNLRDSFPHPYTPEDARDWITLTGAQRPEVHFAIAVDGNAVGGIGVSLKPDVFRRSAEIGYWLGESFWNDGIVTEAVQSLTAWAFDELTLNRIYAGVFAWNSASARVLEKAGYHREATLRKAVFKDGEVTDEIIYATFPSDWPDTDC